MNKYFYIINKPQSSYEMAALAPSPTPLLAPKQSTPLLHGDPLNSD